jgi:hypothetical protein
MIMEHCPQAGAGQPGNALSSESERFDGQLQIIIPNKLYIVNRPD